MEQHSAEHLTRHRRALETLLLAEDEANKLVDEVKNAIKDHEALGEVLKKETTAAREIRNMAVDEPIEYGGKGKARELSPVSDDSEDYDLPKTPAGQEHGIKRRALQQRLRECHVTLHRIKFLQGDVHHALGGRNSNAEDEAYAAAEELRRGLLKSMSESDNSLPSLFDSIIY